MIIIDEKKQKDGEMERILKVLGDIGVDAYVLEYLDKKLIVADLKGEGKIQSELSSMECVEKIIPTPHPFKLTSRSFKPEDTIIKVGSMEVGGPSLFIIAGPCSVENRDMLLLTAHSVKANGASALRGGAFKPRTSPYSFQGLGEEGLKILSEARSETGLPVVTEAMSVEQFDLVEKYADVVQIGARNMQNFPLLRRASKSNKPILLKRGLSATIIEWLLSAEYIASGGNMNVMLCERGIRTFEHATRNTLDLAAVAFVKKESHLPVLVDPSHATGIRALVKPMAKAAIAAGSDGLIIEVHPRPEEALSDGPQSLTLEEFAQLMCEIKNMAKVVGRELPTRG
ncbi:MAG: 3-deoxy-7-phosphoheptulonate synthase [Candidatus Bathyarchaeia archaeon]